MEEKETKQVKVTKKVTDTLTNEVYQDCFTLAKQNGKVIIVVANKIISKKTFSTTKKAKEYIDSKPWELIVNATCLLYELSQNVKNNK